MNRLSHEVCGRGEERSTESESSSGGSRSNPGSNILSLLSHARKAYDQERGGADQSELQPIQHASGDASVMSQISLDDLFRTVNLHQAKAGMADSGTDTETRSSVFARSVSVSELESHTNQNQGASQASSSTTEDTRHPILRMISSKTVEEIEKQHLEEHKRLKDGATTTSVKHRKKSSSSPKPVKTSGLESSSGGSVIAGSSPGMDLMQMLAQAASQRQEESSSGYKSRLSESSPTSGSGGVEAVRKLITMQDPQFGTNRGFIPVPTGAKQVSDIESNITSSKPGVTILASSSNTVSASGGSSSFMSPSVFTTPPLSSLFKAETPLSSISTSSGARPVILKPSDLDPSLARSLSCSGPPATPLLTPQALAERSLPQDMTTPVAEWGHAVSSVPTPLSKDQLQQAMLHLIKNDTNFVSTLHTAYLESFYTSPGPGSTKGGQ